MAEARAPGWPGIPPRWTSSAKDGIGTALGRESRVWFTVSHGILNEVYYPRIDQACTRDMGLVVTDGADFFSEEKRHATSQTACPHDGVPAYGIVNTCRQGRYRVEKMLVADPARDVVLQRTRFVALRGSVGDYRLHVLLAPHLGNRGCGNTGWVGDYKGVSMLFAEREGCAVALACSMPWKNRSVGFVGFSDGWQDLSGHRRMTWSYTRAENGNIALTGEIDLGASNGDFVMALAFGGNAAEAGQSALASLLDGFDTAHALYVEQWDRWRTTLRRMKSSSPVRDCYATSVTMLRAHEAKRFPGAIIASLSVPWGFSRGDDDLGGYHLVWPRDLVEAASGLLAAGAGDDVCRVLHYLEVTQEADGHWPQNMWLDGTPYWRGVQMDEAALPILLVDLARREGIVDAHTVDRLWPMVRRCAGFIARNGPVTQEDRWEEDAGYAPFTLAAEVAALLAAADMADREGEGAVAAYLRETADAWNASIEEWTYVTDTDLAREVGVDGYYVRVAPPEVADGASPAQGFVPIKNRPPGERAARAVEIVSPDALALVRFGLRSPHDPRIVNTVRVIDALLRVELPGGPGWHRYSGDGYGEHADGSPFDGQGVGRVWPLLTGERAHYELAAGRPEAAASLLRTLESFANESGLLPEQVWDAADVRTRELFFGRPAGSAMPLVWAHAEYVKLRRSLDEGRVFDRPSQAADRRVTRNTGSCHTVWRFNQKRRTMPAATTLRLEVLTPATIRWSADAWRTVRDIDTIDTGLGVHRADLPTAKLAPGTRVNFTFHWRDAGHWEGTDFTVTVGRPRSRRR